ncbi:MAG: hypothetical protein LW822_10315 [Phycisphaeraceae bacterium]|jgi:uncharacterized membrane protein|nr:hypothetical protein [Phycisphaeraceae bacterium]
MKSWKTTVSGIVAGLAIIFTQVGYLLDNDPATTISIEAIVAACAVIALGWNSRDKSVSTEEQVSK